MSIFHSPNHRVLFTALILGMSAVSAFAGAKEGEKVFADNKCIKCHTLGSQKGKMHKLGGKLDGVGTKRTADWIKKYLKDPAATLKDAKMPKVELSEKDLADVTAYMASLK